MTTNTLENVREYYGNILKSNRDLQTNCCTVESVPSHLRAYLAEVPEEVATRFYGCGSPIPPALDGMTVLDLGCGAGRDCFLFSKLVGPRGKVIGIDMTEAQLAVARKHVSGVTFLNGYIEDLEGAGIASSSIDVVVSNCVVNLSPDKRRVFSEIFRVLKPGGELYFSDVFADRRVPKKFAEDPVLLGECLGGALYIEDFRRMLAQLGCRDYRVVSRSPIRIENPEIESKIGMIRFASLTVRAFKLEVEDRCEDYGQVAYYLGTIPESPHTFTLDDHHVFKTNQPMLVCSNTASMLAETRFKSHFKIVGDTSTHFGLFDCGPTPMATSAPESGACC